MAAEILFVGDMHLGRRPRHLPRDLEEFGIGSAELTPAAAFRRLVDHALDAGVAAVVFAGDVVDSENSRFEAYGQLRQGVNRLTEHHVEVFAVAGNHDVEALPRLADSIEGFRLLGRGGSWEQVAVHDRGRPFARLLGWSFPAAVWDRSPVAQADFPTRKLDDLPLFGILHCDLGASGGAYAPVAVSELAHSLADGWFLGHIHTPSVLRATRPIGYLGSLVGLDPSETGPHGAWTMRVHPDSEIELERWVAAPLRWEGVDASIDGPGDAVSIERAIRESIESLAAERAATADPARAVGCRIRLVGTTDRLDLRRTIESHRFTDLRFKLAETLYFVDRVEDGTEVAIDLESLAARDDPPGLLAAKLLALQGDDAEARPLLQDARRELQRTADDRRWLRLEPVTLDDATVRRLLIDSGRRVLAELVDPSVEGTR